MPTKKTTKPARAPRKAAPAKAGPRHAGPLKAAPRTRVRRPAQFSLKNFFKLLNIPQDDQPRLTESLRRGLRHFYIHLYGTDEAVKAGSLREQMARPFVFGFGAVEAARTEELSLKTRVKVVDYAIHQTDVEAEYGLPHGLPAMLAFLARASALKPELFRSVMIAADFDTELFDDFPLTEAQDLLDWQLTEPGLPEDERLWWTWHLTLHCEPPSLCRSLAEVLLAHEALSPAQKRALCLAWLNDSPLGKPPPEWEAMQALWRGDLQAFATAAAAAGMPVPDKLSSAAEIEANYDAALEALLDETQGDNTPAFYFTMLRRSLVGPMGIAPVTPVAYKREALFALAGLGEDPLGLCLKYLDSGRGEYYADAVNLGVLDVLAAYSAQLPEAEVRTLVERALVVGAVPTRRAAYQLGAELWGDGFLRRAAADPAKVIRSWASKRRVAAPVAVRRGRA